MKKFLLALLTGLVIAVILCGCDTLQTDTPTDIPTEAPTRAPFEMPSRCLDATAPTEVEVEISDSDWGKILSVLNGAEWTYESDPLAYTELKGDFVFEFDSGAEVLYEVNSGRMYDRDNSCYFYLSDKDKTFVDEVLTVLSGTFELLPDAATDITHIKVYHFAQTMYIKDDELISDIYDIVKSLNGKYSGSSMGYYGVEYGVGFYDGYYYHFQLWDDTRYTIGNGGAGRYPDFYKIEDDSLSRLSEILEERFLKLENAIVSCTVPDPDYPEWRMNIDISDADAERILTVLNGAEQIEEPDYMHTKYIFKIKDGFEIYYDHWNGNLYDASKEFYWCISQEGKAFIDEVVNVE